MSNTKESYTQTNDEDIEDNKNIPHEFKCKIDSKLHKTIFNKSLVKNVLLNDWLLDNFRNLIGCYYSILHKMIMIMGLFIIIFSNDIISLCAVLLILFLDSVSNIIMYDCPLTMLEKSYLGHSFTSTRLEFLQNIGILYTNSRVYDTQLELIINVSAACIFKILLLCIFKWYNIITLK
uniref:Uncharacterized protein n=1 Tax=viral metagenome TaxID=1070528 RepID=A0A6C0AWD9_9ZZZZ|tara:strand:- start:8200 stop:8733 length:534 start_codon:yes stop_codon:yes gene_type:complete